MTAIKLDAKSGQRIELERLKALGKLFLIVLILTRYFKFYSESRIYDVTNNNLTDPFRER